MGHTVDVSMGTIKARENGNGHGKLLREKRKGANDFPNGFALSGTGSIDSLDSWVYLFHAPFTPCSIKFQHGTTSWDTFPSRVFHTFCQFTNANFNFSGQFGEGVLLLRVYTHSGEPGIDQILETKARNSSNSGSNRPEERVKSLLVPWA